MAAATSITKGLDLPVGDASVLHNSNKLALRLLLIPAWCATRQTIAYWLYDSKGSADQAYAQRDNCETLQNGSGDDDSVPVALQRAGVRRRLVGVGSRRESAVDRRTDA